MSVRPICKYCRRAMSQSASRPPAAAGRERYAEKKEKE